MFRPGMIVDRPRLRRAGLYAGAAAALCALLLLLLPDRMPVAVARIFAPFADIPPATGVGIRVEPGDTARANGLIDGVMYPYDAIDLLKKKAGIVMQSADARILLL